ncbi:OmpA family protein [Novosphingobium sp. RD2P27]|uniref:OmpA family protein n=1 Tax=Novosphingobium kalidii TaxID=3230299 RepID=A0ABV2D551_9SPHN
MTAGRAGATAIAALMLVVAGCDGGIGGGGGGAMVDTQAVHPNGAVLQVLSVQSTGERTLVSVRVINGRDREIRLDAGRENSYILTDSGEKLLLVPSPTNANLAVPPSKMMDGALLFAGTLPSSGSATLMLNGNDSRNNRYSSSPRFEVALPLAGSHGGSVPEVSALSNMQNLPASTLGSATGGGSNFGQAGRSTSNLTAVDKLKSELGAVDSERGTVVSLPGDVTFDFDKATIQAGARTTLDRLAELIQAGQAGQITIEGHTDAKGDDAYNKRLSEQRAAAVKTYLIDKGVAADRLQTIGLGELRPVAPNANADGSDDEAGRRRNRRVEVILPQAGSTGTGNGGT